jgi:hypothetical protein
MDSVRAADGWPADAVAVAVVEKINEFLADHL